MSAALYQTVCLCPSPASSQPNPRHEDASTLPLPNCWWPPWSLMSRAAAVGSSAGADAEVEVGRHLRRQGRNATRQDSDRQRWQSPFASKPRGDPHLQILHRAPKTSTHQTDPPTHQPTDPPSNRRGSLVTSRP